MNDKRSCKIVQDLFPSYIEKLTDEESNKFIEEHLKDCTECTQVLENMKKEIKSNSKVDKNESNYIKKFSNKMKILKAILIVIVIIFIASTTRNVIIISILSNKAEKYVKSTNYYKKEMTYDGEKLYVRESYKKDGKTFVVSSQLTSPPNKKKIYSDGENTRGYIENEKEKIAVLNLGFMINENISNELYTDNILYLLWAGITTTIRNSRCDGKECYYISSRISSDFLYEENGGLYIDKETGLAVRTNTGTSRNYNGIKTDCVSDIQYEFNVVTDDIFIEPDISEYTIVD